MRVYVLRAVVHGWNTDETHYTLAVYSDEASARRELEARENMRTELFSGFGSRHSEERKAAERQMHTVFGDPMPDTRYPDYASTHWEIDYAELDPLPTVLNATA